jgi:hypothetical protein
MCTKFEWPAIHHAITHNQHNTTKNKNTDTMISPNRWLPVALILGKTLHIPSFSETRSPWTVWPFGIIPEQEKCIEIYFCLFQWAARNKSGDFWAAQKYLIIPEQHKFLLFVSFIAQNWLTLGSKHLIPEQHKMLDFLKG